ncbi:unnamed protein product, partial [Rotaria magnacalcarata]
IKQSTGWSTNSISNGFAIKLSILSNLQLATLKCSNSIGKIIILYWFDTWYEVLSSNSLITPTV